VPGDWSCERIRLEAECLALAKQSSDMKVRASLLKMAQKWHEFADFGSNQDVWTKTFYHRAIQVKIGQELRATYDLPQEISHRMGTLLVQLNDQPDREHDETAETAS
jgi:hypothetical protein